MPSYKARVPGAKEVFGHGTGWQKSADPENSGRTVYSDRGTGRLKVCRTGNGKFGFLGYDPQRDVRA